MTFERNPGPPPEPGPTPVVGTASPGAAPTPVQVRLQILSTEHWSLLASRGLAWNEAFSRAGMYLSTLSASIVTLGLIGGIDGFGTAFFAFAFVILPVDLFVGLGAWTRIAASNYHDAQAILGMNRIRAAYLEIAPDLAPYFVMGVHDDLAGASITMAVPPGTPWLLHLIASTPFLVVILNTVVAGAITALVLVRAANAALGTALAGGLVTAVLVLIAEMLLARRNIRIVQASVRPMFPTPPASDGSDRAGDRPGA
jgi:hypothetical protein